MRNPALASDFLFCDPSIGGVSRLWATPYVRMALRFQVGVNDIVKDIASPVQWFEVALDREQATFEETAVRNRNGIQYRTVLSLFFSKMQQGKRLGVRTLAEGKHTAIIQDANGQYHLIGYDNPVEFADYKATPDKFRGANGYSLVLQTLSPTGVMPINAAYVREKVMGLAPVVCPGVVLGNDSILYTIGNCIVLD